MSDTMDICGLKAERGQKLQTYIPVLDSNTKIPITIRHPEITSGSIAWDISIAAAIPGYSPPWLPAVIILKCFWV